jgi:hypothetical protein
MYGDFALERMRIIDHVTTLCLRTLLLFNGGAIVALFTVLGNGGARVLSLSDLPIAFGAFTADLTDWLDMPVGLGRDARGGPLPITFRFFVVWTDQARQDDIARVQLKLSRPDGEEWFQDIEVARP